MPTPNYAWPLPEMDDPANVPADLKALGDAIDATVKTTMVANPPVGALLLWPSLVLPVGLLGFLFCQGQQVDAIDYPDLGTILGVTAGKITIPDLRNRFPVGVGSDYALNAVGGEKTHTLTQPELPAHTHPNDIAYASGGAHDHTIVINNSNVISAAYSLPYLQHSAGWFSYPVPTGLAEVVAGRNSGVTSSNVFNTQGNHGHTADVGGAAAHSHTKSGGVQNMTGGGSAHENRPPYLALNFIIRAR